MREIRRAFLFAALACAACEPTFESRGALTIAGAPFDPTACRVLTAPPGVELRDASGARLEVTLPRARVDAFREAHGSAGALYRAAVDGRAVDLSGCATLSIRGEGYHASGRRALSGGATFACPRASGRVTFSGCF